MKLLTKSSDTSKEFLQLLRNADTVQFAVAWASTDFAAADALLAAKTKIRQSVVGTHFYQTSPDFIAAFSGSTAVKFVKNSSGVFHPKIYIFESASKGSTCIVGSSNFTNGGFQSNDEISLLINEDEGHDEIFKEARSTVKAYWKSASLASDIDLENYRKLWTKFKKLTGHAAGKFGSKVSNRDLLDISLLHLDWPTFLSNVRQDQHHATGLRIEVLQTARSLFRKHGSLAAMAPPDRKGIAGFLESGGVPWGWFGSMKGAGVFKNLVNEDPAGLSAALDEIPMEGPVTKNDYDAFLRKYLRAFPKVDGHPSRHGLGTATRLLAMKRPDYFVCLDRANRKGLSEAFGVTLHHHDYEDYWQAVIERILLSTWWNSRRPSGGEAAGVWDGRAAFLDAIYYEPV